MKKIILICITMLFLGLFLIGCVTTGAQNNKIDLRSGFENYFETSKKIAVSTTETCAKAYKDNKITKEQWEKIAKIHNDYMKAHNAGVDALKLAIQINNFDTVKEKQIEAIKIINEIVKLAIEYGLLK